MHRNHGTHQTLNEVLVWALVKVKGWGWAQGMERVWAGAQALERGLIII
jgi:hypothetical protein